MRQAVPGTFCTDNPKGPAEAAAAQLVQTQTQTLLHMCGGRPVPAVIYGRHGWTAAARSEELCSKEPPGQGGGERVNGRRLAIFFMGRRNAVLCSVQYTFIASMMTLGVNAETDAFLHQTRC